MNTGCNTPRRWTPTRQLGSIAAAMEGHAMNRWRQRLVQMRGGGPELAAFPIAVQKQQPDRTYEHFEQIEQPTDAAETLIAAAPGGELAVWDDAETWRPKGNAKAVGDTATNRWRHRLAELRGDTSEQTSPLLCSVQNVQNRQPDPAFEHFEQVEQPAEPSPLLVAHGNRTIAIWGQVEQEHAANVGCDGEIPRQWGEGFARLDPDRSPADVPSRRWLRLVTDVALFLDSAFCATAAALGWGPLDLFGCDRDRPFARIDQAGLLWLLNGDRLLAVSEDAVVIETRAGARRVFRRKPNAAGRVLVWELRP